MWVLVFVCCEVYLENSEVIRENKAKESNVTAINKSTRQ